MKELNTIQNAIFIAGGVLLLIGAATYILRMEWSFYAYALGACAFSSMQMLQSYEGTNFVIRRLRRQQLFGAFLLLLTIVPMAMNTYHFGFAQRNEWIVTLSVAAVLELYSAFRLSSELEKNK